MNPDGPGDPDKYQQAWQAHTAQTRVTVDADLLKEKVQSNQQELEAENLFSDFVGIGLSLLLLPLWIYMGVTMESPWTWYLMVPAYSWIIGFTLAVRARRKQTPNGPGGPLLGCVQQSLALVEQQIWLFRNISWWYILPIAVPLLAFTAHVAWSKSESWLDALVDVNAFMFAFLLTLFYFTYYLNQRVVRTQLEPRRGELLALLASLSDESTSEVSGEYPILMNAKCVTRSRRRMFVGGLCFVAIMCLCIVAILAVRHILAPRHDHPEKSPFTAVRWQDSQPEIKLGDEWFQLVSLDDLPAAEIVAFSRQTYGNRWRKRFEEDLVELLTRMGHPPRDTVTLVVQSLTSLETQVREDVPMTYANRREIRAAAQGRENSEP